MTVDVSSMELLLWKYSIVPGPITCALESSDQILKNSQSVLSGFGIRSRNYMEVTTLDSLFRGSWRRS